MLRLLFSGFWFFHPALRAVRVSNRPTQIIRRRGMTLIEVLIATTMTLLIMLALAQGFKTLSQSVSAGRSRLSQSDQLRGISSLLRADLDGLTCDNQVPQDSRFGNGYFMYYDGPLSDSSAMLFNYLPTASTVEERLSASRWGDIDDVLMFTAKAKDGEWFRGKVPKALLLIDQFNKGLAPPAITVSDWLTDVSIASEFAEVVWFTRPLNEIGTINDGELPPYGFTPPGTPVNDVAPGIDRDGDGVPDPDGMPDRLALCRRTLLIRPDLQITHPGAYGLGATDSQLTAQPMALDTGSVDSFRYMMRFAYERCDLSIRPFFDGSALKLATNSLADLQRPENRFAHYVMPTSGTFSTGGTSGPASTLPILALTNEAASTGGYLALTNAAFGQLTPTPSDGLLTPADRGFIPAAFFRRKITVDASGAVISSIPTLEEIVASNVVAFDLRGFDISARQLASPGVDGGWGTAAFDDNGDGTVDNAAEAGWPGTDDLVLSPSDPGYAAAIFALEPPTSTPLVSATSGAFVDLCWARRVVNQLPQANTPPLLGGMSHFTKMNYDPVQSSLWGTALSGYQATPLTPVSPVPTPSHIKAGKWNPGMSIYQPVFDTFTDSYESDGDRQDFVGVDNKNVIAIWANGLARLGLSYSSSNPVPDQGANGIDDSPIGGVGYGLIDDLSEKETSPPFAYRMPSIQAKIRVQDAQAGTLQEISIIHDLTGF